MDYGSISSINSDKKIIHLPLCCKNTMQMYCLLTDCTRNRLKLPLCRLLTSCVSFPWCIPIFTAAFAFKATIRRQRNKLVTKADQFGTDQNYVSESDRACYCWSVLTRDSAANSSYNEYTRSTLKIYQIYICHET